MMRPALSLILAGLVACAAGAPTENDPGSPGTPGLGPNASLNGRRPLPDDNPWNTPVDGARVDPNSDALIASIGLTKGLHPDFGANYGGGPFGIPYIVVGGGTQRVNVVFDYADESDPGTYPIPPNAPIDDEHVSVATTGSSTSCSPPTR